ncbi:MAG: helix-turn-helix domain-containing protein [Synergistaceae bacterium]|nr:helix-turn-helix domain-containing protein [Synergistaceae bacterium]
MPENREDVLRDLGIRIRQKREELELSLREAHEGTKIRAEFLEGIERGDYSEFPGTVYIRGFIRTYLRFLGAEELWESFLPALNEGELSDCDGEMVVGTCTLPAKGFRPASRFWLFVILMLVLLGSSWYVWYTWSVSDTPPLSILEETGKNGESRTVSSADQQAEKDVLGDAPGAAPDKELSGFSPAVKSSDLAITVPPGMTATPTAAELVGKALPETSSVPVPAPEEIKKNELVINASGDCWVRVQQGKKTLFERTLKSGDRVSFPVEERITVIYGRAGAVTTQWNGEDLGNPGRSKGVERMFYAPDGTSGRINQ